MGVRVRLTRNTSAYIPFWVAIPVWFVIGCAWLGIAAVWLLAQIIKLIYYAVHR